MGTGIWISGSAVIVSFAALFVAVRQTQELMKHNRLSVKPHLEFTCHVSCIQPQVVIAVTNNGIGPAFIKRFNILLDNRVLESFPVSEWSPTLLKLGIPASLYTSTIMDEEACIGSNESRDLLVVHTQAIHKPDAIFAALGRLDLAIEYESAYEEKFETHFAKVVSRCFPMKG